MTNETELQEHVARLVATRRLDEPTALACVRLDWVIMAGHVESLREQVDPAALAALLAIYPMFEKPPGDQDWFWFRCDALSRGWPETPGVGSDATCAYLAAWAELVVPDELSTVISATRFWRSHREQLS